MLCVFIDNATPKIGIPCELSREESHHLVAVLRIKSIGTPLIIFNRHDQAWEGILEAPNPKKTILQITREHPVPKRKPEIHLAQALPKGKTMEDLIRKAVEIGVTHFHPLITEHTEVHLKGERLERKQERWESVAIEACKQSGNLRVPQFSPVQTLPQFLQTHNSQQALGCVASLEPKARHIHDVLSQQALTQTSSIVWLVGPEGDFSPNEYHLINQHGFKPIRLADHVLKVETAVVYALSITDCWSR